MKLILYIFYILPLFSFSWLEKENKIALIIPNIGFSEKQQKMIQKIIHEIHNYTDIPKEEMVITDEQAMKFFTFYNNYKLIIFGNEYNNKIFQIIGGEFFKTHHSLNLAKEKIPYQKFFISEYFGFFPKVNINMIINTPQVFNYKQNKLLWLNKRPIIKNMQQSIFVYLNSDNLLNKIIYSLRNNIFPYIFTENSQKEYYNISYEPITSIPKKFNIKQNDFSFISYGQENLTTRQKYDFIDYKNTSYSYTLRYKYKQKYIKSSLFKVKKKLINWEKFTQKIFENKKLKVFQNNDTFFFIIDKYIFIIKTEIPIINKLIKQWQ